MSSFFKSGLKAKLLLLAVTALAGAGALLYYRSAKARPKKIPIEVLFANPQKAAPTISPDGTKIAYLAPVKERMNIWIKSVDKNDDRPLTTQQERDITDYSWAFDNKHIIFSQDTKGDEKYHVYKLVIATGEQVDLTPFKGAKPWISSLGGPLHPNEILIMTNKDRPELFDLYRIDLQTNACTLVEKNPGFIGHWYADHDMQIRAATRWNADGSKTLLYRTTVNDPWRELESWDWQDAGSVKTVFFSRDGKSLYFIDPKYSDTAQAVCLDPETGKRTIVAAHDGYDVNRFVSDSYGTVLFTVTQEDRLVWRGVTDEYDKLVRAMQRVDTGHLSYVSCTAHKSQDPIKQTWILSFAHDDRSMTYYLFDAQTNQATFLFAGNPALDQYQLAHMQPIVFKARDGLDIHGYLTLPIGRTPKKLPLVLCVHGGPCSRDMWWSYDSIIQLFANRGYACLQVNYRGSSGYGKKFVNAGNREWGGKMQDDLTDAVHWAINQGIADPKKIAIYGASYGGYAALVGATSTPDLFCCAIDRVGQSNLVTFLRALPPSFKLRNEMALRVGNVETEEEFLKSRSPFFKVDAIKIPILVIQAANDPRVNRAESDQMVAAMRAKKLDVEYLVLPDEGHRMGDTGEKNKIVIAMAMEKFLAKHLDGQNQKPSRETIFDRIVDIPKDLVLDVPYLPPLCDTLPGLQKGSVDIPDGKLYYEEEGNGIPLVLLHGGPGGTHHVFHPYFSAIKDVARIIYYDQRGSGQSSTDATGKNYTIRQAVEDLEVLRRALKLDRWAVLGWSYGGFLAQCYALTYPEHVTGLILVAAKSGLTKVAAKPGRGMMFVSQAERDAIQKIYGLENLDRLQRFYNKDLAGDWKRQGYHKPTPEEFIREARYEWSPAPGFNNLMSTDASGISLDGRFDDFEIPTLIMEAEWDLSWGTDKIDLMRKNHPHAQLEVFKKSGHQIFADEPEKFFGLLKNFLATLGQKPIVHKPGNRIVWPEPPSELTRKLAIALSTEQKELRERLMLECYDLATKEKNRDVEAWFELCILFVRAKKYYDKCLTALQNVETFQTEKYADAWQAQGYRACLIKEI